MTQLIPQPLPPWREKAGCIGLREWAMLWQVLRRTCSHGRVGNPPPIAMAMAGINNLIAHDSPAAFLSDLWAASIYTILTLEITLVGIRMLGRTACARSALYIQMSAEAARKARRLYMYQPAILNTPLLHHAISFSSCQNLPVFPEMSPSASKTGVFAPSSTVFTPPPLVMSVFT